METAIGVFSSRAKADEAVAELLKRHIPKNSIVFLTRSETEAQTVGKELGAFVGGFVGGAAGMSAGVVAATSLLLPGVGPIFAIGFGAAALLGLAGAGTGAAVGQSLEKATGLEPTAEHVAREDIAFFRDVLKQGRSLVIVRTEFKDVAGTACEVLDRHGLGLEGPLPGKMQASTRHAKDVVIVDISGRITVGEGNIILRDMVRELMEQGHRKFLIQLAAVEYMDSSGIGELVGTVTTVRNKGGALKLLKPSKRVRDLLHMTRLHTIFDIADDEASAIVSFGERPTSEAVA